MFFKSYDSTMLKHESLKLRHYVAKKQQETFLLIVSSEKSGTYVSHSTMIRHIILIEQKI